MRMLACATALMMLTGVAVAQNRDAANSANAAPGGAPAEQFTVTNYYKQDLTPTTRSVQSTMSSSTSKAGSPR